jgi:hypothetical protein
MGKQDHVMRTYNKNISQKLNTDDFRDGSITYAKCSFSNNIDSSDLATDSVAQAEIAANAVGQSEIKTAYHEVSAASTATFFTFSGGAYAIGHTITTGSGVTQADLSRRTDTASLGYGAYWRLNSAGGTSTARLYYINSSPPYNLGDGNIPLFIYVEIDSTGDIVSMSSSTEAPWHYNGPTNITPSRYAKNNGVLTPYIKRKDMSAIPMTLSEAESIGIDAIAEYNAAFLEAPEIEMELTQDIKNADIDLIPLALHNKTIRPNSTTVLLDPVSDLTHEIFEMRSHNEFFVTNFIMNWCELGAPVSRAGPKDVPIIGYKKRLTRS